MQTSATLPTHLLNWNAHSGSDVFPDPCCDMTSGLMTVSLWT